MLKKIIIAAFSAIIALFLLSFFLVKQPSFKKLEVANNTVAADSMQLRKHVQFLSNIQPARNFENITSLDSCAN